MPVGIQGCAAQFIDTDGFCRPSSTRCPGGTIPKLDEGCVPVGIQGCAPGLLGRDGLCRPTPTACRDGEIAVPSAGCVAIDGPGGCGDGTWGSIAEQAGDVHVDPSYAGGQSDGSRQRPFVTIGAAIAAAEPGGRVVLAAGDYDEPVVIQKDLGLIGRCAALVGVHGLTQVNSAPIVLLVDGARATIEGVRIHGDGHGIEVIGGVADVRRVEILGALLHGAHVEGSAGELTLTQTLIAGTRGMPPVVGANLYVGIGTLRLDRMEIRDAELNAFVERGGTLEVTDSVIKGIDNPAPSVDLGGIGVFVTSGKATLDGVAVVGHKGRSLWARGSTSQLTARNSLIDGAPGALPAPLSKLGACVTEGGNVELSGVAFTGSTDGHAVVADAGSELRATGSLFQGPPSPDPTLGGIGIQNMGAKLSLDTSAIVGAFDAGVSLVGTGTSTELDGKGLIIERTVGRPAVIAAGAASGMGLIAIADQGTVKLASSYIAENDVNDVYVSDGIALEMTETLVEGPPPTVHLDSTSLLGCSVGSSVKLSSVAGLRGRGIGLLMAGCQVALDQVWIDGITPGRFEVVDPPEALEDLADGIMADRATLDVRRTRVTGCERAGLLAKDSAGTIAGSELRNNAFGLVLEGNPKPTRAEDARIDGNNKGNVVNDGDLPVPVHPPPLPP